jgi:DNA repair exonuclease SbcCD nuclease subunit
MKAIICGDVHIGAVFGLGKTNSTGGNTRIDDYETTLNNIIDYTISSGAEVFIQTGDLFETRNPTPEHIEIADRAIRRLSDNHIFTIIILVPVES